jgi:hypothetical protein
MSRDPARIDRMCELLRQLWQRHPDQRMGQLIGNLLTVMQDPGIAHIEDARLERKLTAARVGGIAAAWKTDAALLQQSPDVRVQRNDSEGGPDTQREAALMEVEHWKTVAIRLENEKHRAQDEVTRCSSIALENARRRDAAEAARDALLPVVAAAEQWRSTVCDREACPHHDHVCSARAPARELVDAIDTYRASKTTASVCGSADEDFV